MSARPVSAVPVKIFEAHKARMRDLARNYARGLKGRDMEAFAEHLGAKLVYMDLGERDGAFDPDHNVILVNSSVTRERQRFTVAHEVSHALLLGDEDLLSDLHDAFDGDDLENAIETLCNVGASAILVPDELLRACVERHGATGQVIADIARKAEVSAQVALYALADFVRTPAIFAVCGAPGGALVVQASAATSSMRYSLSSGTPIPSGHPIDTAYRTGLAIEEASFFPFRSGKRMPALVSAYPLRGRVYAAFEER
ncbi:ImmA/IrrE family metallo-endopeptidase [Deinococcus yavapaiensis]|uniref:Zn-dependent peptidase ImmA (M78 family) n=1 Tax=Deinococcus yavapaiensis KR-236 TaxID=694435 RepID=A0A318S7N9_9DEIO|nr:ImmA/IrrE family metallo-endopeptidase [Deinococcus yavapaiensis]PYE51190.1 Zn-dependent peptidase ImmA (M78 family) [Deinococcus yavapaiensis KR-236]